MKKLANKILSLKSELVAKNISKRVKEFKEIPKENLFFELCFCLLTANFKADKSIIIQREIGSGFMSMSEEELATKLKNLGHRFWPQRANRIVLARKKEDQIKNIRALSSNDARTWLIKNIKGLGTKESSHFLRNIGFTDLAIIDFHIIDLLNKEKIIFHNKKSLTSKKYMEIENTLRKLANLTNLNLAELDLYLWYIETNKVLK